MPWVKWVVVALVVVDAGYMVVDGTRALTHGDYFTPGSGDHAGQLGPWARAVEAVGIDPRSTPMKTFFVVYGLTWLGAAVAFAAGASWSWTAMVLLAVASVWYAVPGMLISAVTVVLLFLPVVRDVYRAG